MRYATLILGVFLSLALSGPVAADLCEACRGLCYPANVGTCEECSGWTSSGAFRLCRVCSARLEQCEHCRASLQQGVAPADDAIAIDESMNGHAITVRVGQRIAVRLRANATTGFAWRVTRVSGHALAQVGSIEYIPDPLPDGQPIAGSGGTAVATFRAVKHGTATVTLAYQRPWEKRPALRTFRLTVRIQRAR